MRLAESRRTVSAEVPFAYDEIAYPTPVVPQMATERMRSAGILHGYQPPDPSTASVLEIGCGDAYNLIAMAEVAPQARHVGFDLAAAAIERGQRLAAAAGLTNVELSAGDILTWPRTGEQFGYISCHGVYSWVPAPVRPALLDLIAARLAPGGIAYISFDCLPAASAKVEIQNFLRTETAAISPVPARVAAAMALLKTLAASQRPGSRLKPQLDALMAELPSYDPAYFFHDWLADHYAPQSLRDFAAAADKAGLAVAGDAGLVDLYLDDLTEAGRGVVSRAGTDWAELGFRRDVLRGNQMFRRALLVRKDAPPPAAQIDGLAFAFAGERKVDAGRIRYVADGDVFLIAANAQEQAALDLLADGSFRERSFADIAAKVGDASAAAAILRRAAALPLVTAHATPAPYTLSPGDRPMAGGVARAMLSDGNWVITRRHAKLILNSEPTRAFVQLCDGTRDRAGLADALSHKVGARVALASVDAALADLARRRILIA